MLNFARIVYIIDDLKIRELFINPIEIIIKIGILKSTKIYNLT